MVNRKNQSGQVLLLFVLLVPIVFGLLSLAYDVGRMNSSTAEFETAADSAALAGGRTMLSPTATEAQARASLTGVGQTNTVRGTAGSHVVFTAAHVTFGQYDLTTKTFTPKTYADASAVRVRAPLDQTAGRIPMVFSSTFGFNTFNPTRGAIVSLNGPSKKKPSFPMAVDKSWFTHILKSGTIGVVRLDPYVNNAMWSGFTSGANSNDIRDMVNNPASIPTLSVGQPISITNGVADSVFKAVDQAFKVGDVVTIAVTDVTKGSPSPILGFTAFRITKISVKGINKFIEGELIPFKDSSNEETLAVCYGLNCRPTLVE